MIYMKEITFIEDRNASAIQRLNDFLAIDQEPHPVAVQQLEKLYDSREDVMTGTPNAIKYLITMSDRK